jgi:hypothetical protein
MNTDITLMSDIELAKIQGQCYEELLRVQGNLMAIKAELAKREPEVKPAE